MGGSVGGFGGAMRQVSQGGGKSSGMGRPNYGNTQGFTPVGQDPARVEAPVQQPQQPTQQTQYIPGSAMNGGFGGISGNSGFPSPFGGGYGGKSSGLGQMGMMNSPFGGFNPYAQQPMGGMRGPMGMPGNSGFPDPRMQRQDMSTFNQEGMPQQQFNPYPQQPQFGGLAALAAMLQGRMFAEGGEIKEDDEE